MKQAILLTFLLLGAIAPAGAEDTRLACAANYLRSGPPPKSLIVEIQTALSVLGFDPGPPDGVLGPRTRASIRTFRANTNGKSPLSADEYQLNLFLSMLSAEELEPGENRLGEMGQY